MRLRNQKFVRKKKLKLSEITVVKLRVKKLTNLLKKKNLNILPLS